MKKGLLIVLDGLDGSGKGVQTKLLIDRLRKDNLEVEMADFPQYGNWSSAFVEKYLRGEFGSLQEISAKKASLFFALDRYAASFKIKQLLLDGKIVISNRYVSANKGHQLGKLSAEDERKHFLSWVNEMEYSILGIPIPHLTFFLHMKPDIGQRLVDQKQERSYTQGLKRDIHEADLNHLKNAERAFLFCLKNDPIENWQHIICFENDEPRAVESIHEEIYEKVKKLLS